MPIIPTPDFFAYSDSHKTVAQLEREENLKLWQNLTSDKIPLADIERVVYKDSHSEFYDNYANFRHSGNLFYIYLANSADDEIFSFLSVAKQLEEARREAQSPWYYPQTHDTSLSTGDFSGILEDCLNYTGTRLKDRYGLQAVRALFASGAYLDCINYSDSIFADIPDDNLFKRMARRYVAGCFNRIGEYDKGDSLFACAGEIKSITDRNPVEFMARINPDAPQIIDYIRENATDSTFMSKMVPIALRLLKNKKVRNKGDWNFLLAYIHNEYYDNPTLARKHIYASLNHNFSSPELKDMARCYKIKLDAMVGNSPSFLSDLKWLNSKTDTLNPDAKEWIRRLQNIIYVDCVPALWNRKDYATAILLCSFADNVWPSSGFDYGSLSFQLMGSLPSSALAIVYTSIHTDSPLYNFLRTKAHCDRDYFYELIGTLSLREENYSRAIHYLSRVSDHYLCTMNIDKRGYLARDPFSAFPSRWRRYHKGEPCMHESTAGSLNSKSNPRAKLNFARRMINYKHTMMYSNDPDRRGMARLMFAIGRRNSFEECWALTQYSRGFCENVFYPSLQYWDCDFAENYYNFLYDYETSGASEQTEAIFRQEVDAALAMLSTDEARAEANYILGNLRTILKFFPETSTADFIKTSCDNWKSWL